MPYRLIDNQSLLGAVDQPLHCLSPSTKLTYIRLNVQILLCCLGCQGSTPRLMLRTIMPRCIIDSLIVGLSGVLAVWYMCCMLYHYLCFYEASMFRELKQIIMIGMAAPCCTYLGMYRQHCVRHTYKYYLTASIHIMKLGGSGSYCFDSVLLIRAGYLNSKPFWNQAKYVFLEILETVPLLKL